MIRPEDELLVLLVDTQLSFLYPLSVDGFLRAYRFLAGSFDNGFLDSFKYDNLVSDLDNDFEEFDIISFLNYKSRFE